MDVPELLQSLETKFPFSRKMNRFEAERVRMLFDTPSQVRVESYPNQPDRYYSGSIEGSAGVIDAEMCVLYARSGPELEIMFRKYLKIFA